MNVDRAAGHRFGPFADKAKADRWADQMRDAFDLCRYRTILAQSPNGRACAYKQMGKCPAPCDGSIAFEQYREQARTALVVVREPASAIATLDAEMRREAAELNFERAGKLKLRIASISALRSDAFANVRPIEAFRYVTIQPGGRKGTAKVWLITAHGAAEIAGVLDATLPVDPLAALVAPAHVDASPWPGEVFLGTVCYHLGSAKGSPRFSPLAELSAERLATMLRAAMKIDTATSVDAEPMRETRLQL